jgi:hypothetical protein
MLYVKVLFFLFFFGLKSKGPSIEALHKGPQNLAAPLTAPLSRIQIARVDAEGGLSVDARSVNAYARQRASTPDGKHENLC